MNNNRLMFWLDKDHYITQGSWVGEECTDLCVMKRAPAGARPNTFIHDRKATKEEVERVKAFYTSLFDGILNRM